MKNKIFSLAMAVAMAATILVIPSAAASNTTTTYQDVPTTFWAYEDIKALSTGGLLKGVGGGKFDPQSNMTLEQYVTVIARLRGEESGANTDGWAGQTVADAKYNKWLEDSPETNIFNYGKKPISRRLAIATLVRAVNPVSKNLGYTETSIPDWFTIGTDFQQDILTAYNAGITNGVDTAHNFDPMASITRAEVAAILNRAGYTTAKAPVLPDGTAPSSKQVYTYMKTLSPAVEDVASDKSLDDYGNVYMDYTKDSLNGGFAAEFDPAIDVLHLYLNEAVDKPVLPSDMNSKGVYKKATGFSYESRQMVKKILQYAYPTSSEQAYQMFQKVFAQNIYDADTGYANGALWIDGRTCLIGLGEDSHGYADVEVVIGAVGDRSSYTAMMNEAHTMGQSHFDDKELVNWMTAFELNKW